MSQSKSPLIKDRKEKKKIQLTRRDRIIVYVSAALYVLAIMLENTFYKNNTFSSSFIVLAISVFLIQKAFENKKDGFIYPKQVAGFWVMLVIAAILGAFGIYWVVKEVI